MDFSNPFVFPPQHYPGIGVLRLPTQATPQDLYNLTEKLARLMNSRDIKGKLWIAQRSGVREYSPNLIPPGNV
jgi:hypothetical protein